MNFVLDTNAVSETRKPLPSLGFVNWLAAQDPAHLFITTVTLAEVWNGFHSLEPDHPDYQGIKDFASDLPRRFRVLNFDARAAALWGEMTAKATGPLPLRDSFIAAIVRSRGYRIVTRDTVPFQRMDCRVVVPWRKPKLSPSADMGVVERPWI
ncbi:MAG: PIN domain-containing protein [Verrucomicrobia bacterium]|nr:PIN domain-containing protein [Verrucomicrobiota bacterium]